MISAHKVRKKPHMGNRIWKSRARTEDDLGPAFLCGFFPVEFSSTESKRVDSKNMEAVICNREFHFSFDLGLSPQMKYLPRAAFFGHRPKQRKEDLSYMV